MTPDLTSLENELRKLRATPLDDALLQRLDKAAEGSLTEPGANELRFEAQLRETAPATLSGEHLKELEAIFSGTPFAMNEKILLFPRANNAPRSSGNRPMWAAAAAVALVGAVTALMIPMGGVKSNITPQPLASSGTISPAASHNLVPAGFDRGVSKVSDEGLVWKNQNQPHNLMRVEYVDKVTFKDNLGRIFQMEEPRSRYILVPARTD